MAGQAHFLTSTATLRSRARVFSSRASCIIKAKPGGQNAKRVGSGASGTRLAEDGTLQSRQARSRPSTLRSATPLTFPLLTSQKWGDHRSDGVHDHHLQGPGRTADLAGDGEQVPPTSWPPGGARHQTNLLLCQKLVGNTLSHPKYSCPSMMELKQCLLPPPSCVCITDYAEDLGFPGGSAGKDSACNAGDLGSIPGLGRSPGEGHGNPLQYSGLENSTDCIVHGVAKSRTRLSNFHLHFH